MELKKLADIFLKIFGGDEAYVYCIHNLIMFICGINEGDFDSFFFFLRKILFMMYFSWDDFGVKGV